MADNAAPTHDALVKRFLDRAKKHYIWLEVGTGRLNKDGTFDGLLDRMPIGGFSGHIYFLPKGMKPPEPEPARPDRPAEEEEEF